MTIIFFRKVGNRVSSSATWILEDENHSLPRNVGVRLYTDPASHRRRTESPAMPFPELQNSHIIDYDDDQLKPSARNAADF